MAEADWSLLILQPIAQLSLKASTSPSSTCLELLWDLCMPIYAAAVYLTCSHISVSITICKSILIAVFVADLVHQNQLH